jgi:hypothetical protein
MTRKRILILAATVLSFAIFLAVIFHITKQIDSDGDYEIPNNNAVLTDTAAEIPPHTLFTWGRHGGPALHDATDEDTLRGDYVHFVHGSAATGNDDPAILRFGGVAASERERNSIRNAENSLFTLTPATGSENRSVWVWTDLSDEISVIGSSDALDFLVSENVDAGAIVRASWANPFEIEIPIRLLYISDGQDERFAEYIYVFGTLGTHGGATSIEGVQTAGGLRTDVTANIYHAFLRITETPPFATNISLNIGADETEMRFTWWTPKGEAEAAVLQVAPYANLIDGQMPADALTIHGEPPFPIPSDAAQYAFDVNRAVAENLSPDTRFAYRVGDGTPENWSAIHHFDTFSPREGHTVLLIGDPQMGGSGNLARQIGKFQNALDSAIQKEKINFIMNAGDNFSPANSVERASAYLFPTHLRNIPVFTTVGNHDTVTQSTDAGFSTLSLLSFMYNWANHDWLGGNPTHTSGDLRGGGNHFFVYGDALYISLNTNLNETPTHRAFLKTATESHPDTRWRIVLFHQDIFGNGTGHAASMPGSNRQMLLHALCEFEIDLVVNGHEHTHSRSHFMRGRPNGTASDIRIETRQRPAEFSRNRDERLVFDAHTGAFISPEGIPFITLGSVSDFPKYTSIFPLMPWTAWTDPPQYDNYAQYSLMRIDGDSLSVETWAIPYDPSNWAIPSGAPEIKTNSFAIRKTANADDLKNLIEGAKNLSQGDVTNETWAAFEDAIFFADYEVFGYHDAFMNIYDAYFALENTADNSELDALINEVNAVLAVAVEGPWEGQFREGSIADLREVFLEPAAKINSLRLSSQAEIDRKYSLLRSAFWEFNKMASDAPVPWISVHNVSDSYTLNLLHWADDSEPLRQVGTIWTEHPNVTPRFDAFHTKRNFAGVALGDNYTDFVPVTGAVRPDVPFAPANAAGGRIGSAVAPNGAPNPSAHITKTHVGEWIRYELNVARAGEYRVQLGAINPQNSKMEIILRDGNYNRLALFEIPANHGVAEGWENAALIPASNNIFLPAGKFMLEMVFLNNGAAPNHRGSGLPADYSDGANVDILTFERINSLDQVFSEDRENIFVLPLPPNDAAGNALRQRGWATVGVTNEFGSVTQSPLTTAEISRATHLVFEVAGQPGGNIDFVLAGGHSGNWTQVSIPRADFYNASEKTVTIDLSLNPAFELWRDTSDGAARRVIVSHNSDSWDDLNVITAWLVLGE